MSDYTTTPNYGLYKPTPNADVDSWGAHLNSNADTLDSLIYSVQAHLGNVWNALDHGVVADGTTDTSAAIRTLIAAGGAIYFPAGRYLFNGPYCVIPPNTRIFGDGPAQTVFVSGNLTGGHQDPTFGYFFVSQNYDTYGALNGLPTTPARQTDINITIENVGFDFTSVATNNLANHMIARFLWAANVRIRNVRADNYAAITSRGFSGFAFLGCDNYSVESYYCRNAVNAIDQWQGNTRAKHSRLWLEQVNGGGNGGVINWQGAGTQSGPDNSHDLQISDATLWLNNSNGLFLDSFGAGSTSQNILLSNIKITAKSGTTTNDGIVFRGNTNRLLMRGITFSADTGADMLPILMGGIYDQTAPLAAPNIVTTTNGSASVVVSYACTCGVGNYIAISDGAGGPITGNGVTFNGWYPVTAVSGTPSGGLTGTSYTVTGPSAATASGPIAVATTVRGYYGATANATMRDIAIDGCAARGGALIQAHGHGHVIDGVVVTQNYNGAASPQYNAVVSLDTTEAHGVTAPAPCFVGNIIAAAGTGSLPAFYAGNNVVQWANTGLPPTTQFRGSMGFNGTAPIAKPTVTGAKGSNAALASLLTALAAYGLVTDTTTA